MPRFIRQSRVGIQTLIKSGNGRVLVLALALLAALPVMWLAQKTHAFSSFSSTPSGNRGAAATSRVLDSFSEQPPTAASPTPTPALGNYSNTSVALSGNLTVTPSATPEAATSINVSTSTKFKGTLVANTSTGVVRVTDAHPAGSYTVTVTAFGGGGTATKTFTLTVQQGTACLTSGFTNGADVSAGNHPYSVAVGDFNNDGKQDLAVANYYSANVSIRLGDGSGAFSSAADVSVGSGPQSVAVADFNNDGKQDIAVANNDVATVSIALGNGNGIFTNVLTDVSVGNNPISLAVGDFNNDGKQDFAVANDGSANASIRLGNGSGGFTNAADVSVGTRPKSLAIGDFNNDGKQDIAVANGV